MTVIGHGNSNIKLMKTLTPNLSIYLDENGRRRDADPAWFSDHVPLWAKATSQGKRVSVRHWSACDVPHEIDGREPQL